MNAQDDTILQLVRLGLKADTSSIERYANRLLRRADVDETFQRALSELLVAHATGRGIGRRHTQHNSGLPLNEANDFTLVEHVLDAIPPILPSVAASAIESLVRERSSVDALQVAGLEPTRSVLLVGRPGVGKTMTARHLAQRLKVPLISLDLVTVMSSLLGQSGHNIRRAIEQACSTPCVFLLDEIDAIAKRRDDQTDVGELKRVVNLLLLELDRWPSTSLLIAATNHPELLDRALWRRFDLVLEIPPPDESIRRKIVEDCLVRHRQHVAPRLLDLVGRVTPGASGSELALLAKSAVRESLLGGEPLEQVLRRTAILSLARRNVDDEVGRRIFCRLAHDELNLTHREIGSLLGVSHVTVGKILKQKAPVPRRTAKSTRSALSVNSHGK